MAGGTSGAEVPVAGGAVWTEVLTVTDVGQVVDEGVDEVVDDEVVDDEVVDDEVVDDEVSDLLFSRKDMPRGYPDSAGLNRGEVSRERLCPP
ncbi:MAG: hypothetical protein SV966_10745 [Actinomycetota bacterium]|nr:hypothetical protein [Actinomycetota bacterium]